MAEASAAGGGNGGAATDPGPDAEIAILFTSGATGPPKGVRYLHRQLAAQRDALAATYGIGDDDRLVAAFAPFALYGPTLGVPTALADADVTKPGELTADALDAACRAIRATMVFASPAALANVVRTARCRPLVARRPRRRAAAVQRGRAGAVRDAARRCRALPPAPPCTRPTA